MLPFYEKTDHNIRASFAENIQFPPHLHSALEILYVESGSLSMSINGHRYPLGPGTLAIVFPNLIHDYQLLPETASRCLLIICEPRILPDFFQTLTTSIPACPILTKETLHPDALYALYGLEKEFHSAQDFLVSKAFLQLFFGRTLPLLKLQPAESEMLPDLTYRLVQYISQHFKEPLTLSLTAQQLNVSKYHLSRIFSQKLHMNFNEYLNQIRLDYAMALIRTTKHTFTYISLESGFENQRTFNRVFRRFYGKAPSEFRH